MLTVSQEHIEIVQGSHGPKARIVGSRIRVIDIVYYHRTIGWTPEEIAEQLPTITLADVHGALAYYHDHREEIDAFIEEDKKIVEDYMRTAGPGRLAQKHLRVAE